MQILHPIASGLSFLALLAGIFTSIPALFLALLAFLAAVVVTVTDFVGWAIVRGKVNGVSGAEASFGNAIWCVLAAVVVLLFAVFAVCLGCCGGRRRERRVSGVKGQGGMTGRRRGFWGRRTGY